MQNKVNLQDINDQIQLKSMAYDQMVVIERGQANLQAINQRLAEVQQAPVEPEAPEQPEQPEQPEEPAAEEAENGDTPAAS